MGGNDERKELFFLLNPLRNLSFRNKLYFCYCLLTLVLVITLASFMLLTASRQSEESSVANLQLLTEQALMRTISETEVVRQHLYSMSVARGTLDQVQLLQRMEYGSAAYRQGINTLMQMLNMMTDSGAPYDFVSLKLTNGDYVHANYVDANANYGPEIQEILSMPEYAANHHGVCQWVQSENGSLFMIRDLYLQNPLRYGGKIAAHIRRNQLVDLDQYIQKFHYSLLLFDSNRNLVMTLGEPAPQAVAAADQLFAFPSEMFSNEYASYFTYLYSQPSWYAIGLMPKEVALQVQHSILQSSLLAAAIGLAFGLLFSLFVSRSLSRRMERLVFFMNQASQGDLDVSMPVSKNDEIGIVSERFNEMIHQLREQRQRLIEETMAKDRAEYQNMEYEYRFLQWQINPHFIYNALETVNSLAKLNNDEDTSEMIVLLSDYFRQNAESMSSRFATIFREFGTLRQYADIYQYMFSTRLTVTFQMEAEARNAYVPTMLIQPLLENALVHGTSGERNPCIVLSARVEGERLIVDIQDNGDGISQEQIDRLLSSNCQPEKEEQHTSLGIRNVISRMRLLYGETCCITIRSTKGVGTVVSLMFPLQYQLQSQT